MSIKVEAPTSLSEGADERPLRLSSDPDAPTVGERSWKKPVAIAVVLLVVAGVAVVSWFRPLDSAGSPLALTHAVTRGDLSVSITEKGTLESSSNEKIKCRVKGGSTVIWVIDTGTQVKPGDVVVRLDTSKIEDTITQQRINAETARGNVKISEAEVVAAKIAITEYVEGTFKSDVATKQKELVIAQSQLKSARNALDHSQRLFRKGYISRLQYETQVDAVHHAELEVKVKQTDLDALERFTREKTVKDLEGKYEAAMARLAAYQAALDLEEAKLRRAEEQLKNCTVRSEASGIVIYPSAAEWSDTPDIKEGATVREDQVLLMIPDLSQMQVKIGVHESKVDRVKPGMTARVEIQGTWVDGEVASVATVTRPTGWWNGNVVKYDTIIKLKDKHPAVRPGMSVAVEVVLAEYNDVVTVPVAAVVEYEDGAYCWVENDGEYVKRKVKLGDTNDEFVIVEQGVRVGEQVILNPLDFVEEARDGALLPSRKPEAKQKSPKKNGGKSGSASTSSTAV